MRTSTLLLVLAACGGNGSTPAARQAVIEFFTAGPAGGTFALPGGVEIELPPGAVAEPTEFRYEELDPVTLSPLPAHLTAMHAFRILGRTAAPVASPQLAAVDGFDELPLSADIVIRMHLGSRLLSNGEEMSAAFLAKFTPTGPEPLVLPTIRGSVDAGLYQIAGRAAGTGTFAAVFGLGTIEFSVASGATAGIQVGIRRGQQMQGPIDVVAAETTVSDGATLTVPRNPGAAMGTLDDDTPFLDAFFGLGCGPLSSYALSVQVDIKPTDFTRMPPVPESLRVSVEGAGTCEPEMSTGDRDGNWVIPFVVTLLEELRLIPEGWLDTAQARHVLCAYATGFSIANVFDLAQGVANIDFGGLTGTEFGAFLLGDASADRSLSQLSQPSVQTVVLYGKGGGFIRRYTPGQGFAPLSISIGVQLTDGGPMNNDPLSGIGIVTNNIGNDLRLVSGSASGMLPAGVPGRVAPTGFPAGAGKIFCTFMRSTARTLVVTQGSPGAVWIIKDLNLPVVTKLADTENDPRRIRVCGDIVVISNFGSNSLSIYRWNQNDTFTFIKHEPVCNGPVGFDLKKLDDGRVAIVSTGFFDHKYAITVVDPVQLTVKSGPCTPLIAGCEDPGHAIWVPDEDEHRIVASCNGTDNLASMAVTIPD